MVVVAPDAVSTRLSRASSGQASDAHSQLLHVASEREPNLNMAPDSAIRLNASNNPIVASHAECARPTHHQIR